MELRSDLSKKYIADALIILMKKKNYSSITIQDIVDKAGLSRMTYYRNFNSKDDIIKFYLESITNEFLSNTNLSYDPNKFNDYIMILFNHLLSNKELGFILKEANLIYYVKDLFDRFFYNKSNSVKEQYNYYFISGGLYNIYYYWLVSGCKESPEELAEMFTNFFNVKSLY